MEAVRRGWIVVHLEWMPRDAVLDWADGVLRDHADRSAIVVTHAYLRTDDGLIDLGVDRAGPHGEARRETVDDDETLGALTVGTEDALGAAVFGMVTENMDSVGDERRTDHFIFIAAQRGLVP